MTVKNRLTKAEKKAKPKDNKIIVYLVGYPEGMVSFTDENGEDKIITLAEFEKLKALRDPNEKVIEVTDKSIHDQD